MSDKIWWTVTLRVRSADDPAKWNWATLTDESESDLQVVSTQPAEPWEDYVLIDGEDRIELEHIGEGWDGDYDPDDPDDQELVRFTVSRQVGEWQQVDDASYCTQVPITITLAQRESMARIILGHVKGRDNIKRICEDLSWLNDGDLGESH